MVQGMSTEGPVLCIMGATATGKSDLAIEIAQAIPSVIISVDSVMIYRDMDIGSAKPSKSIRARIPHHLIDILTPDTPYSAALFCDDVLALIKKAQHDKRLPILVGGTMLYFKALIDGLHTLPDKDPMLRNKIEAQAQLKGWPHMHAQLAAVDPTSAEKISENDPHRITRALEIFYITGLTRSEQFNSRLESHAYDFIKVGLEMPRDILYQRINQRFSTMIEQGFIQEVEFLKKTYPELSQTSAGRAVGYKQVLAYLNGEMDEKQMLEKGAQATRNYAKRQLTWLNKEQGVKWFSALSADCFDQVLHYVKGRIASQ